MAMTNDKTLIFLDTNILIRLHVATAPQHDDIRQAVKRLLTDNYELWVSRQVLREYAAVLTRVQPYTTTPFNSGLVAQQLRLFETNYRIADEVAPVTVQLCGLLETILVGGKQVHDANIVATMVTYGIKQLFTFNRADFVRFSSYITIRSLEDILKEGN